MSSSTSSSPGVSEFKAAVLHKSRAPLVVDTILAPPELKPGQVAVRVRYSGICGAQVNEIDAIKGPDKFLPHLLGHEGVGEVLSVGPLVKSVVVGDTVILHWMPGAGVESDPAVYSWRERPLNAGWVTTLSEASIVSENRVTRLDSTIDPRFAPLLGCAATTATGVVGRDAAVRLGESVVVIGAGGVGLLVVEAARASGAFPIIAIDQVNERLSVAQQFGANITLNSTQLGDDLDEAVISALGDSPDVVIETSGAREMVELGYQLVQSGGRCVLVGVTPHDQPVSIDTLPLHFDTVLTGSKGGGTRPEVDIPRTARLAENGLFRMQDLPITVLPLDAINNGIDELRGGRPGRIVIDMEA